MRAGSMILGSCWESAVSPGVFSPGPEGKGSSKGDKWSLPRAGCGHNVPKMQKIRSDVQIDSEFSENHGDYGSEGLYR